MGCGCCVPITLSTYRDTAFIRWLPFITANTTDSADSAGERSVWTQELELEDGHERDGSTHLHVLRPVLTLL